VLDVSGYVKVTDSLQLVGHPDIFALGDIISYAEQKQVAKIPGHGAVVVANLLSLMANKPTKKKYGGTFEMIAITNGKVCLRSHLQTCGMV
jgi:NADH dehydrogenase FAD-containing subunit